MGDLATILGIQMRRKLAELPAQGYLETVGSPADIGAPATYRGPDQAMVLNSDRPGKGDNLPAGQTTTLYQTINPNPQTYIPPATGDKVAALPDTTRIVKKGEKAPKRRTIYLQNQVPVIDERGVQVGVVGPAGAPFLPDSGPQPVPIPNTVDVVPTPAPHGPPGKLVRPYLSKQQIQELSPQRPPVMDRKQRGVFLRHLKDLSDKMYTQLGIPT